jgi:hypothetical protein
MIASIPLGWIARAVPLPARAVFARGPAARALARRLLDTPAERLRALRGCASDGGDALFILSSDGEAALPWADGACYLGHDPAAPDLLLPTNRAPAAPVDLVAAALAARLGGRGPWAVVPRDGGGLTAIAVAGAAPVARPRLDAWLVGAAS